MRQFNLNIFEIVDFYKKIEKNIEQNLHNYLSYRINNKLCTIEELENIHILLEYIKSIFIDEQQLNKIYIKVQKLILLSRDNINKTNYNKRFEELNKIIKPNINELCEYIELALELNINWINMGHIETNIKNALKTDEDRLKLLKLLKKYELDKNKEYEQLEIFILKNQKPLKLSQIIKELFAELKKEIISSKKVKYYLDEIKKFSGGTLSSNEIDSIIMIFKYIEENQYFKTNIDNEKFDIKTIITDIYNKNLKQNIEDNIIKQKLINDEIILTNNMSKKLRSSIALKFDILDKVIGERIIAIDPEQSPDLDGAFSIQKFDDLYILNIYISDVPCVLKENKELAKYAYERGMSHYVWLGPEEGCYNIDMLPPYISHKFLSLNKNRPTNTIAFNFIISENGEIYSSSVDRKIIKVTDSLTPKQAEKIINSKENYGMIQNDLLEYQKLCKIVSKKSNDLHLKNLNCNIITNLVAFSSIMVNYFIGKEAQFAIYRENGQYVKKYENNPYTHSATPLRKIVSDINLAFFLNQNKVVSFLEKDLNLIESNVDVIIEHLKEKENLDSFIQRHSNFVKKYIK